MCALLNVYGYKRPHPWEWSSPTWFSFDLLRDWLLKESLTTCPGGEDTEGASSGPLSIDTGNVQNSNGTNSQLEDITDSNLPIMQSEEAQGTPDLAAPPPDVAGIVDQVFDELKEGLQDKI